MEEGSRPRLAHTRTGAVFAEETGVRRRRHEGPASWRTGGGEELGGREGDRDDEGGRRGAWAERLRACLLERASSGKVVKVGSLLFPFRSYVMFWDNYCHFKCVIWTFTARIYARERNFHQKKVNPLL